MIYNTTSCGSGLVLCVCMRFCYMLVCLASSGFSCAGSHITFPELRNTALAQDICSEPQREQARKPNEAVCSATNFRPLTTADKLFAVYTL